MKKYEKPFLNTEEFDARNIISTSLIPEGEGTNDNPLEWSLRTTMSPVPAMDPSNIFDN